ncbi:MAG TPA: DUF5668 domain-containing protein [Anaerolineaceae bacterium]|nr:DUF5668 domain-containing protein [Anaerolineaceae bacterium]
MDIEHQHRHSIGWPLILIAAGILFLLNNIGLLPGDIWDILVKFWPVLLIIIGLDNLVQGEGLVGALFIAGIGAVFLLNNLGFLYMDVWGTILRFWPVLIIAAGLDILVGRRGRRSVWMVLTGILLFIVLFGSLLWLSGQNSPIANLGRAETVQQDLGNAKSAAIEIEAISGSLSVHATQNEGQLIDGTVQVGRGERFRQDISTSGTQAQVRLVSSGWNMFPAFGQAGNSGWDLGITQQVPVDLDVSLPVGRSKVDLTGLELSSADIKTVIGQNKVQLPEDGAFEGNVENVIGQTVVLVPQGTPLRIQLESGMTTVRIPTGFQRDGNTITSPEAKDNPNVIELKVNQTMGSLVVQSVP